MPAASTRDDLRVVVIGAGMAGILSAITLKEAGVDFAIYEKADRLGGTWRENTYPGIACDVPSHFYSYSFALNPDWSSRFAPGPAIQAYFEDVAHRFGVDSPMSDGSRDEADVVIAATGVLHHPAYPAIEEIDSFAGPAFHSARWDHGIALVDKRVGVIGTGSSAIQIVTELVDRVRALTLFQRTPQWITPTANGPFTDEEKEEFRKRPEAMRQIRRDVSDRLESVGAAFQCDRATSPPQAVRVA